MRSFFAAVIAMIALSLVWTGPLVLLVILFGFDETDRYHGHVSLLVAMSVGSALLGLTLLLVSFEGSVERAFEWYPETWKRLAAKSAGVFDPRFLHRRNLPYRGGE